MGVEMSGEDDLIRRIDARRTAEGERPHALCRSCKRRIGEGVRVDSAFCSPSCHDAFSRRVQNGWRREIRSELRRLAAPRECAECGAPLDNRAARPGPTARMCSKRCRNRAYYRRRLAAITRAAGVAK